MQQQLEMPSTQPPERSRFSFALTLAAAAVVIVIAGLYFLPGRQSPSRTTAPEAHFGAAEQAYAPKLRIENITLSRAENFLHQEVTTLSAELLNTGDRSLRAVELTIEFSDDLRQVVLREARSVLAPGTAPFAPAERRTFEVSFEHIPSPWNRQQPVIRITGLQFIANKY
jgi:hypothetical protein